LKDVTLFELAFCIAALFGLCVVVVLGKRIARWWKTAARLKRYKQH
jgi:hypothetical protein